MHLHVRVRAAHPMLCLELNMPCQRLPAVSNLSGVRLARAVHVHQRQTRAAEAAVAEEQPLPAPAEGPFYRQPWRRQPVDFGGTIRPGS